MLLVAAVVALVAAVVALVAASGSRVGVPTATAGGSAAAGESTLTAVSVSFSGFFNSPLRYRSQLTYV